MATLTIRKFDDGAHALLRARAASNGRSVESEVRSLLESALALKPENERVADANKMAAILDYDAVGVRAHAARVLDSVEW